MVKNVSLLILVGNIRCKIYICLDKGYIYFILYINKEVKCDKNKKTQRRNRKWMYKKSMFGES